MVSRGSVRAARRAAGAVVSAIDRVIASPSASPQQHSGHQQHAFCLVRPPGHHACVSGYDPVAGGSGFCLLNSVAIGAAHAMSVHGCRVAIVDIDVHHGNGTEDIVVKRLCRLGLGGGAGGGASGAGGVEAAGGAEGRVRASPPTGSGGGDPPVLFCSIHLYEHFDDAPDDDFFPGRGGEASAATLVAECDSEARAAAAAAVLNLPIDPLWAAAEGNGRESRGREAFRAAVAERLVPRLAAFAPSLLLFSAGFDGALGDEGNTQDGIGGLDLTDDDFHWVTTRVCESLSDTCAVVSVLEGGYGAWDESAGAYDRASLASGCAAHVRALAEHSRARRCGGTKL